LYQQEIEELQTQLYIITGVLSGAILILFLFVIALIVRLERRVNLIQGYDFISNIKMANLKI